jgi:O-antigen/teichoic acid export membrane protein
MTDPPPAIRRVARLRAGVATLVGYSTVVAGSAGARFLGFVGGVLVARLLGPSDFGDFTIFFALMVIFSTVGDFIDITYVRHVNAPAAGDRAEYLRAALMLRFGLFVLVAALALPLGIVLAELVFGRPELRFATATAMLTGASLGLVHLLGATFLARGRLALYSGTTSFFYVAIVLVLLPLYTTQTAVGASAIYVLFLGTSAAVALLSAVVLLRASRPLRLERRATAELVRFAKWLFAAGLVQALYQRLDIIILARFVAREDVGQYGAAIRYAMIGAMMLAALMGFLLPKVSRTRASPAHFLAYLREAFLLTTLLLGGLVALWMAAPALLPRLFGADFEPAVALTRILLLATMLAVLSLPFGQLLLAEDRPKGILHMGLLRLVAIALLALLLVPRVGAAGAAWAMVAAEAAALGYAGFVFIRRWPRRYRAMQAASSAADRDESLIGRT